MELHRLVRELIDARGADLLNDPGEFRAALDDFATDEEISVGDANVLNDAVRLGAVRRLEMLLAGGSDPRAAVGEAGLALARDRGSDGASRSLRAVAVLGYALGWVEESVVEEHAGTRPARAADVPPPPPPPAAPTMPPPPPITSPPPTLPPPGTQVLGPGPAAPVAPAVPAVPEKRRSSRGVIIAVVATVLVLVGSGFLAWRFLWPRGGADSPEEAAEQLFTAIAEQDLVAAAQVLAPAEVESLADVYDDLRERLEEEDLLDDEGITDAVSIEFDDLDLEVEELGDDLARVTVAGGTYTATWVPDRLPERLRDIADGNEAASDSGDVVDLFGDTTADLTTVKEGGRWYVTLLGTVADHLYRAAPDSYELSDIDIDAPDYDLVDEEAEPITGEEPEDVVENLVDAVNHGDAEELLANLPADLVRPLRPYLPVVDSIQDGLDWGGEVGLSVTVDDLDVSTEELDDDRVKVVVDGGSFSWVARDDGTEEGETFTVDGSCVSAAYDTGCLEDEPYLGELGLDEFFLVVAEVDDGYQLDPVATLVEYVVAAVDAFEGDVVDRIIDRLESDL